MHGAILKYTHWKNGAGKFISKELRQVTEYRFQFNAFMLYWIKAAKTCYEYDPGSIFRQLEQAFLGLAQPF